MKIRKEWLALLVAPLVLVGCGGSPEDSVKDFYRSVEKGEISKAKGHLSKQIAGMLGEQKLTASLGQESTKIAECGGIKDIDVQLKGEGEVRAGTAKITYKGSCPEKEEKVSLVKEDGKWTISLGK